MRYQVTSNFASVYGESAYGECVYNDTTCSTSAAGGAAQQPTSGSLVNTGTVILFIVSLACLIICASLIIRFARRKKLVVATELADRDDTSAPLPR